MDIHTQNQTNTHKQGSVHHVLAQSYFLFFVAVLVGFFMNVFFPIKINAENPPVMYGAILILIGTWIVVWAQKTSRKGAKDRFEKDTLTHHHFFQGPYKYFRSPTHVGLTFLVFGYGLLANSFFIILSTVVFSIISKIVYIKREEKILEEKYGQPYSDYKKKVKM